VLETSEGKGKRKLERERERERKTKKKGYLFIPNKNDLLVYLLLLLSKIKSVYSKYIVYFSVNALRIL